MRHLFRPLETQHVPWFRFSEIIVGEEYDIFLSEVDYKGIFNVSVINILWAIAGGQRFRRDDQDFKQILRTLDVIFRSGDQIRSIVPVPRFLLRMFPVLRQIFGTRNDLIEQLKTFFEVTLDLAHFRPLIM